MNSPKSVRHSVSAPKIHTQQVLACRPPPLSCFESPGAPQSAGPHTSSPRASLQQLQSLTQKADTPFADMNQERRRELDAGQEVLVLLLRSAPFLLSFCFLDFRWKRIDQSWAQQAFPQQTAFPTQQVPWQQVLPLGQGLLPSLPQSPDQRV